MKRRELPLTSDEKQSITTMHADGWTPGAIATALFLHKRQVTWYIEHGMNQENSEAVTV